MSSLGPKKETKCTKVKKEVQEQKT